MPLLKIDKNNLFLFDGELIRYRNLTRLRFKPQALFLLPILHFSLLHFFLITSTIILDNCFPITPDIFIYPFIPISNEKKLRFEWNSQCGYRRKIGKNESQKSSIFERFHTV